MVQHKKATAERWIDPNMRDSAGSPVMGVRGKYEGPIRDHKKATAKRWIDPNMRDSAGSPIMGVRGKYESPVRDHKKATAKRWRFCGPNRA